MEGSVLFPQGRMKGERASQESTRSYICVLGVGGIDFVSFYDFDIIMKLCSVSMASIVFQFINVFYNAIVILF